MIVVMRDGSIPVAAFAKDLVNNIGRDQVHC